MLFQEAFERVACCLAITLNPHWGIDRREAHALKGWRRMTLARVGALRKDDLVFIKVRHRLCNFWWSWLRWDGYKETFCSFSVIPRFFFRCGSPLLLQFPALHALCFPIRSKGTQFWIAEDNWPPTYCELYNPIKTCDSEELRWKVRDVEQDTKMGKLDLDSACACASRCTEEPDVGVSGLLARMARKIKGKYTCMASTFWPKDPKQKSSCIYQEIVYLSKILIDFKTSRSEGPCQECTKTSLWLYHLELSSRRALSVESTDGKRNAVSWKPRFFISVVKQYIVPLIEWFVLTCQVHRISDIGTCP